jgi:hypothetical protein
MCAFASIFLDFNLPNATTWFYFSLLLAIALFFKFTRLLTMRNWDVLTLFLLVPGLLLLMEAATPSSGTPNSALVRAVRLEAGVAQAIGSGAPGVQGIALLSEALAPGPATGARLQWFGYLWLFCGSAYLLLRCLIDLALVRRPALSPNLNLGGLAWLGAALFVCLVTVAVRRPASPPGPVGKRSAAVEETQRRAEYLVQQEIVPAVAEPVDTTLWVECTSAVLCHLAIVIGLGFIGWRHFQDAHIGVAAATFYLLLPYTAYHVDQVHHVLPAALLLWAVAAYRRPSVAGLLLGLASATGYFPALVFPAWISFYWRRGAGRFALAFALATGLALAVLAAILWTGGDLPRRIQSALSLSDWQPWLQPDPRTAGFWTGVPLGWAYRVPVFIAYAALVIGTLFWPSPKNLGHLIALSAAILLGIQFWFADQGGVYVLWYLPLLLLLVFRPNLSDRLAAPLIPESDWLARLRRRTSTWATRWIKPPEPLARVH